MTIALIRVKGGPGSGFTTEAGHCGIPGEQGGSQPIDTRSSTADLQRKADWVRTQPVKFIKVKRKGGPGSGNFDHCGRPGEQGGSLPADQCQGQSLSYDQAWDNIFSKNANRLTGVLNDLTLEGYRIIEFTRRNVGERAAYLDSLTQDQLLEFLEYERNKPNEFTVGRYNYEARQAWEDAHPGEHYQEFEYDKRHDEEMIISRLDEEHSKAFFDQQLAIAKTIVDPSEEATRRLDVKYAKQGGFRAHLDNEWKTRDRETEEWAAAYKTKYGYDPDYTTRQKFKDANIHGKNWSALNAEHQAIQNEVQGYDTYFEDDSSKRAAFWNNPTNKAQSYISNLMTFGPTDEFRRYAKSEVERTIVEIGPGRRDFAKAFFDQEKRALLPGETAVAAEADYKSRYEKLPFGKIANPISIAFGDVERDAEHMLGGWLQDGGTLGSAWMQAIAAKAFRNQDETTGYTNLGYLGVKFRNPDPKYVAAMRWMYDQTQAYYSKGPGKKTVQDGNVQLLRGVLLQPKADPSKAIVVRSNLESWSTDARSVQHFGNATLTETVPVKKVLATWKSMARFWEKEGNLKGKKEYIIIPYLED